MRGAHQAPRVTRAGEPVTQAFGLAGFAAQALIYENQLVEIPIAMPFPQAAMLGCGVVTGAGAVLNTARVHPGDTVAIVGAGGVGLNAVTAASLASAAQFELDALVSAEISLDQIESGYQKLADPEVSRVVITRF